MKNGRISDNPYFLMMILLVLWGSFAAVGKLTLATLDSFQLQFYMFGLAFAAMTVIYAANGGLAKIRLLAGQDLFMLVLISVPSYLYFFLYTLALKLVPAVEASMLNYLFPILIVVFSVPINGEKLNGRMAFSIILGFLGTSIILTDGKADSIRLSNIAGDLFALGAAAAWAVFTNLGKKSRVGVQISNYIYTGTGFILSTISLFAFSQFTIPSGHEFAGLFWIGISNIVLGNLIWFRALKLLPTALAASISFITPFITLLFIMFLLHEKISLVQLAGFLVIIAGIAVNVVCTKPGRPSYVDSRNFS